MVPGEKGVFKEVKPLLLAMGATVVYCGSIGAGNTTKLAWIQDRSSYQRSGPMPWIPDTGWVLPSVKSNGYVLIL
jgi:hypothetical protein